MTHRGLLICCGFFAANHLNAWAGTPGADIVAVCDRDAARAKGSASAFGIPRAYIDPAEALLAEAPDFVDIVTTSASHRELVELAVQNARVVICQKPMADTYEDGRAMVAAAERAGAVFLVHENFRWQTPFRDIGRRIAAGEIGELTFARLAFRHGFDNYGNQPYLATIDRFALMDVGLHLFDLARHLIGEAQTIACRTQRTNPSIAGEDTFTALVGHRSGATSVLDCTFEARLFPERFPQTTAWIEGRSGTIELDEGYRMVLHRRGGRETFDLEPPVPTWGEKPWHAIQDSVAAFNRHVVDVLDGSVAPQPSGAHNLRTLAMALAAYDAAEAPSVIDLDAWEARQ